MKTLRWCMIVLALACLVPLNLEGRGFGGRGFGGGGGGFGGGGRSFGGGGYGGGGDRGFGGGGDRSFGGGGFGGGGDRSFGGGGDRSFGGGGFGGGGERSFGGGGDRGFGGGGFGGGGERNFGGAGSFAREGRSGEGGAGRFNDGNFNRAGTATARTGTWSNNISHYGAYSASGYHVQAWSHGYMNSHAVAVRGNFYHWNCFTTGWWGRYPGAWTAAGFAAASAWNVATWSSLASFCSIPAQPVYYDYGNTVTYQDNSVYVNGDNVGSASDYNQQAISLASQGSSASTKSDEPWTPLGVFALTQGSETNSENLFQLAISKDGVIRGNYYNGLMDQTTPVKGSIDKKTQRAAWIIGDKKDRVYETGLENLTRDETPVLVHMGSDHTEQFMLVRMKKPDNGKTNGSKTP